MPPTPAQPLARDLFCVSCGYNLRGLDESALCPECGAPAVRSLDRQYFRDAEPHWVRRTGFALQLLPLAGVAWCAAVLSAGIVLPALWTGRLYFEEPLLFAIPFGPRPLGLAAMLCTDATLEYVQSAILFLPIAFYLVILWRLSAPEGATPLGTSDFLSARQLLRFAVLLYAGSVIVFAYVAFAYHDRIVAEEVRAVALGFLAADILLIPLLYAYLAALARRIPNPILARRARFLMFAWLVIDVALAGPQLVIVGFRLVRFDGAGKLAQVSLLIAFLALPLSFLFNTHFASVWHTASRARHFWSRSRPSPAPAPAPHI
jgi:hypothetical protein